MIISRIEPRCNIPKVSPQVSLCTLHSDLWINILSYLPPTALIAFSRVSKIALHLSWNEDIWRVFINRFHPHTHSSLTSVQTMRRQALEYELWAQGTLIPHYKCPHKYNFLGFVNNDTPLFVSQTGEFMGIDLTKKQRQDFSPHQPTHISKSPDFFLNPEDLNNPERIPINQGSFFCQVDPHHLPLIYNISSNGNKIAIGYSYGIVRILNQSKECTHEYLDETFISFSFLSFFDNYLVLGGKTVDRDFVAKIYCLDKKKIVYDLENIECLFARRQCIFFVSPEKKLKIIDPPWAVCPNRKAEVSDARLAVGRQGARTHLDLVENKVIPWIDAPPNREPLYKPPCPPPFKNGISQDHFIWHLGETGLAVLDTWRNKKFFFAEHLESGVPVENFEIRDFGENCLLAYAEGFCIYQLDLLTGKAKPLVNTAGEPYTHFTFSNEKRIFWRLESTVIDILFFSDPESTSPASATFPIRKIHGMKTHCRFLDDHTLFVGSTCSSKAARGVTHYPITVPQIHILSLMQGELQPKFSADQLFIFHPNYLFYPRGKGFYLYLVKEKHEICCFKIDEEHFAYFQVSNEEYRVQFKSNTPFTTYYFDANFRTFSDKKTVEQPFLISDSPPLSPVKGYLPEKNVFKSTYEAKQGLLNLTVEKQIFTLTSSAGHLIKRIDFSTTNTPIYSVKQIGGALMLESNREFFLCNWALDLSSIDRLKKSYQFFQKYFILQNYDGFHFFKIVNKAHCSTDKN